MPSPSLLTMSTTICPRCPLCVPQCPPMSSASPVVPPLSTIVNPVSPIMEYSSVGRNARKWTGINNMQRSVSVHREPCTVQQIHRAWAHNRWSPDWSTNPPHVCAAWRAGALQTRSPFAPSAPQRTHTPRVDPPPILFCILHFTLHSSLFLILPFSQSFFSFSHHPIIHPQPTLQTHSSLAIHCIIIILSPPHH